MVTSFGYFPSSGTHNWRRHSQQLAASSHWRGAMRERKARRRGFLCCWPGCCSHFIAVPVPVKLLVYAVLRDPGVNAVWRRGCLPPLGFAPQVWAHTPTFTGPLLTVCFSVLVAMDWGATRSLLILPQHPAKRDSKIVMMYKFTGIFCDNYENNH